MSYLYKNVNIANLITSGNSTSTTYRGFPSFADGSSIAILGNQNLPMFQGVSTKPILAKFTDYVGSQGDNGNFIGGGGFFYDNRQSVFTYFYTYFSGDYPNHELRGYYRAGNTTNSSLTLEPNTRLIRCMIIGGGGGGGGGASNNNSPGGGAGSGGGTIYVELPIGNVKTVTLGVGNGGLGGLYHSKNDGVENGWAGGVGGSSYITYNGETYRANGGYGGNGGYGYYDSVGGITEVPSTSSANRLNRSNGNIGSNGGEGYIGNTLGTSNHTNVVTGFTAISNSTNGGVPGIGNNNKYDGNPGYGGGGGFVRIIQII